MKHGRQYQSKNLRQRGVSLIEILVVLAILVLGILIIVELFPRGFFTIENTGTATLADSLAQELVQQQSQNAAGLPDAILPGGLTVGQPNAVASDAAYDPDDPNTLENARLIQNETITVPAIANAGQSLYVVNSGPVTLGTPGAPLNPGVDVTTLASYFTVNSTPWQVKTGDSTNAGDQPQDNLTSGQPVYLVDFTHQRIAVPYAPYFYDAGKVKSYAQAMVLTIIGSDNKTYTEYLKVPAATQRDNSNPYAPFGPDGRTYLPDTTGPNAVYQGGWFDPTATYADTTPPQTLPNGVTWSRVMLMRPFQAFLNGHSFAFDPDPYEFEFSSANIGSTNANPGGILFNSLASGRNGYPTLKAQITYQTYGWNIIHEDRDIPAVIGVGGQYIARLTLKRLETAGQSYPDSDQNGTVTNVTYPGIAGSGQDVMILDLDTGQPVTGTINNEDTSGTLTGGAGISVGHSVGRVVFGQTAFVTNAAHRVRIFYQVIGDWTAAVQKAPSQYTQNQAAIITAGNSLLPAQYAFDTSSKVVYFPRCDAGKTVEIDGITATLANGTSKTYPAVTAAIGDALTPVNGTNLVTLDLSHTVTDALSTTATPPVTLSAVRGLSTRAVVAWKENYRWKVHTVDTVLARAQ